MKPYEIIEHTADVGLKVNGASLEELFENAAKGMFEIIAGEAFHHSSKVSESRQIQIKKAVNGSEELLVEWLSELLYIFNREEILFRKFKILRLDNSSEILGAASGQKINFSQTTLHTEIKACTFHGLKIEKNKSGFTCNIIFDV
ncbi:MAG: archease [Candidatus Omnitrophica bacterium]|nr:archease [Candidatus Omnitrophota bacterium]